MYFAAVTALVIGAGMFKDRLLNPVFSAPEVQFKDITGHSIATSEMRGKPVLVTFWATTCSPCIQELPDLIRLYEEFAPEGFRLMAVAMFYDPPNRVVEAARRWRLPYPVILDLHAELAKAFGSVSQIPASFLIAPDGSIAMHQLGRIDPLDLEPMIRELLDKGNG